MGKVLINYQGRELSLVEIAKMNHVDYALLRVKYHQTGDIKQAIKMTKILRMGPRQYFDFAGQKLTINQIAKIYGINYQNLHIAYKLTSNLDEAITLALNENLIHDGEKKYHEYQLQENTESIHKLKNLTYTFNEAGLKTDHTLLNNAVEPISTAEDKVFAEGMKKQIATLPSRNQQILNLRYGLDDGIERTQAELEIMLGVTKARVGRLEGEAIRRLRHPQRAKYYSAYSERNTGESFVAEMKRELASYSLQQQKILCMLYGFVGGRCHTYQETADKFGLDLHRIKRINHCFVRHLPYSLRWKCEKRENYFEISPSMERN